MQRAEITLTEVRLDPDGLLSGLVECPPGLAPAPGQYLLAHASGSAETLPAALFPAGLLPTPSGFEIAPPLPPGWTSGTRLVARGPLGRGFTLPGSARQVALVAAHGSPHPLIPLAGAALVQGAAVALYARRVPAGLPSEVEVLPLDALAEVLGWADFIAIQMQPGGLGALRRRLGLAPHAILPVPAQVLLQVPMPCGGTGECGICAVATRKGWKLTCKDGPVFDFNELEEA
jgi:dihydroorotate dehydrogenase electron transfer subunit